MRLDHVGIATDDAGALADRYGALLDAPVAHEEVFEGDLLVVFLDLDGGYLELLEPLEGHEGPIARHLDRHGPGLHHLAFRVEGVESALDAARAAGAEPIDDEPRPGAWETEVAFLHPRSTGGVLIELVER